LNLDLPCEREVDLVKERVLDVRPEVPGLPDEWVREFLTDGKYVRSRLIFLSYYATGGEVVDDDVVDAAAAIELLHAASLVHDDILDDAETRRGLLSAPVLIGDELALLFGDALFTESFWLASMLGPEVATLAREGVREMVQGEAREIVHRSEDWDPDEAREVAREKTAAIIGSACAIGAELSGARDRVDPLRRFGVGIGVAFQAIDDALDVQGEDTGKPTGVDQRMGAPNLARALGDDGATQARQVAREHAEDARAALEALPDGEARDDLLTVADFIVERDV
jgi:heptaprenyl diphosphate synthase